MLSKCSPFSSRYEAACAACGEELRVKAVVISTDGDECVVMLLGHDSQGYLIDGELHSRSSVDITGLVTEYYNLNPGKAISKIILTVSSLKETWSASVTGNPVNPELVATVTRKLLKRFCS